MRRQLELFDVVRVDHFIGFRNAWEVPGGASNARQGVWAHTPGEEILHAIRDEIGNLPLIAEDLGSVTKEVLQLRDDFGLPGMRVLQWGFSANSFHAPTPLHTTRSCTPRPMTTTRALGGGADSARTNASASAR